MRLAPPAPNPMSYRVDNVPLLVRPLFWLYGYLLGFLMYLVNLAIRHSCAFQLECDEPLRLHPPVILCTWHENIPSVFAALNRFPQPQVWINHPAWFMKPVHVLIRLCGVKRLILGSTGHQGKEAADRLVHHLKEGHSTVVLPDGPHGPPKELKKGALHMAAQSGVPVVALRFLLSSSHVFNTWDKKKVPLPFSRITIHCSAPILVAPENIGEKAAELVAVLGP